MDNENRKYKEEVESTEPKAEDIARISISKSAENTLVSILESVNDGFNGGRVNRHQLASWIVHKFGESLSDEDIKLIRQDHFNEVAMLEAMVRQIKKSGKVPVEMRAIIQKQMGFDEPPKKRIKKTLQNNVINDDIAA